MDWMIICLIPIALKCIYEIETYFLILGKFVRKRCSGSLPLTVQASTGLHCFLKKQPLVANSPNFLSLLFITLNKQ